MKIIKLSRSPWLFLRVSRITVMGWRDWRWEIIRHFGQNPALHIGPFEVVYKLPEKREKKRSWIKPVF